MITTKEQLFGQLTPKTVVFELESGESVELHELTLGQRGELIKLAEADPVMSQAMIVTMACPLLVDGDADALLALPGAEIAAMADKVLEISGLKSDDEDSEKNAGRPNGSTDTDLPSPSAAH